MLNDIHVENWTHLELVLAPVDKVSVKDVGDYLDVAAAVRGEAELVEEAEKVPQLPMHVAEYFRRRPHAHERGLRRHHAARVTRQDLRLSETK